ncbi:ARM-like repeat-containing protein [Apiospora kogelbergensis]|uniref:ARM-like repeat-containing protein n=1 Tax=Apiospora kogelbergensis TaxID=1337665 RepID=UPI00312DF936
MGKSRRNRGKGASDPELAALRESSILPVVKNLQSAEPAKRTEAAGAIANIIQDTKCRKLLLREQVVHIVLTETLTDASLESRAAGWEILKLLTEKEEADFCIHLFRVDVLTAIEHAAQKITETLTGPNIANLSKASKAEQTLMWNIAEALCAILIGLAEAQDEILVGVSGNDAAVRFLFTLISCDAATTEVANGALSCMMTLSEDNRQFVERILGDDQNKCFKHLLAFKSGRSLRAVLACGILHNIFSTMQWDDANPGREKSSDATLIPALSDALDSPQGSQTNGAGDSDTVEILQLALEIIASIGTGILESLEKGERAEIDGDPGLDGKDGRMDMDDDDDDDDNDDDKDDEGEEDEMDDDEIEADMGLVTGADDGPNEISGIDDLPTLKLLMYKAIPQIIKTAHSTQSTEETTSLIRTHALTALNNIAWTVSCLDFSEDSNAAIQKAWAPIAQIMWKETVAYVLASDTSDVGLATIVTSLAWAIARALRQDTPLQGGEQQKFISLYHASKNLPAEGEEDPFQSLGVKCLGVLGQLALDPAPIDLNREIGVFLLTVVGGLPDSTPLADGVEALNQLFDIYGDASYACDKEVFWQIGFLKHFEEAIAKIKAATKKVDKRAQTELRARADETTMNLSRFVQYKQKNKP